MGKGFKPHLLVPETPDTGIELQFQQCVYRTVFAEANVPGVSWSCTPSPGMSVTLCGPPSVFLFAELEEATCCSLESQDFEDAERFGHQFKLTKCRNLEGSCCMALGRNLEGFPLDPDSADVDEVPLFKD